MKLPIIRLTGVGLYSLSRLAVGEIKEIIVRWSGGGYFELDQNSHVIINGDGKAFTNNFSFLDQKYDPYYREGVALVALLAGHGAHFSEQSVVNSEQLRKDGLEEHLSAQSGAGDRLKERVGGGGVWRRKDSNPPPSLRSGASLTGGTSQNIDFGVCPPNEKQLNSLAHVLAIMCLGLRLNVDSIKTLAEVVGLDEELRMNNCVKDGLEEHLSAQSGAGDRLKERVGGGGVWRRKDYNPPPSLRSGAPLTGGTGYGSTVGISDKINLAFYPCEMGSGGEVIRARTQEVLDDMKKGLYRSINPDLVNRPLWAEKEG